MISNGRQLLSVIVQKNQRQTNVEKFLAAWSANGDLCVEDMFTRGYIQLAQGYFRR